MDKTKIYSFCKNLREEGATWLEVLNAAKKAKLVTSYVDVSTLINAYREVAGEIAAYGKLETESFDDNVRKFWNFIGKTREATTAKQKARKDFTLR